MERSADWLDQARGDLQHARSDVERAFYDWACFSAQHVAAKAGTALFQNMGAVVWGHSVADLLEELAQRQDVPEDLRDAALELDKVYILSRYPDAPPSGSPRRRSIRTEAEKAGRACRNDRHVL